MSGIPGIPDLDAYKPAVQAIHDYIAAEMNAASPAVVVAYCETNDGDEVELSLSDLMAVSFLAICALGVTA